MSAALDAALAYAARGWPVVAVRPANKMPLTLNGVHDATTDTETIRRWFAQWPNANVGIACGPPGPIVLDVDDVAAAPHTILDLDVPTVATARGRHLYFAGDDRPGAKLPYGDLLCRGKLVVAPPSVHPLGKEYVWLAAPNGALPSVPEEIGHVRREAAGVVGDRIPLHHRDDTLISLAGTMRRRGMFEEEIAAALLIVNQRCDPPLSERQVREKARSVMRYPAEVSTGGRSDGSRYGGRRVDLAALLALPARPTPWRIEHVVADGSLTIISADGGAGKSGASSGLWVKFIAEGRS